MTLADRQRDARALVDEALGRWLLSAGLRAGERVIVGVSGGGDSHCLLRTLSPLLRRAELGAVVAHLDHGWRDTQGLEDAAFVGAIAADLGWPLDLGRSVPDERARAQLGPEGEARKRRRSFLLDVAHRHGARRILLGHHLDDQLETILLRLARGERVEPAGMRTNDTPWARPLLSVPRAALDLVRRTNRWPARFDPSNDDPRYARTAARAIVRSLDEAGRSALLDTARAAAARLGQAPPLPPLHWIAGTLPALRVPLPSSVGWIVDACARTLGQRPSGDGVARALHAAPPWPKRAADVGGGLRAAIAGGSDLWIWPADPTPPLLHWAADGATAPPGQAWREVLRLPANGLRLPLHLRPALDGERIRPYGRAGTQSVREELRAAGVPAPARRGWPLLVDSAGSVLAVLGARRCAGAPPPGRSTPVLVVYTARPPWSGELGVEVSVP